MRNFPSINGITEIYPENEICYEWHLNVESTQVERTVA